VHTFVGFAAGGPTDILTLSWSESHEKIPGSCLCGGEHQTALETFRNRSPANLLRITLAHLSYFNDFLSNKAVCGIIAAL
jgi:hypothetical protein